MDGDGNVIPPEKDDEIPVGAAGHGFLQDDAPHHPWSRAHESPHARYASVLLGSTWCSDHFGVFRSDILRSVAGILPYYGAEKIMMGEISLRGRFQEIPEVLFYQRMHQDNSVAINCPKQQQQWVASSQSQRGTSSVRLSLLKGHIAAVLRAPLTHRERARCLSVIARYVFQIEKWTAVLPQVFLERRSVGCCRTQSIALASIPFRKAKQSCNLGSLY